MAIPSDTESSQREKGPQRLILMLKRIFHWLQTYCFLPKKPRWLHTLLTPSFLLI